MDGRRGMRFLNGLIKKRQQQRLSFSIGRLQGRSTGRPFSCCLSAGRMVGKAELRGRGEGGLAGKSIAAVLMAPVRMNLVW